MLMQMLLMCQFSLGFWIVVCEAYLLLVQEALLPAQVKALCNGVVETLGRVRYDGKVKHPFTAHPKVDPDTGHCSTVALYLLHAP